MLTKKLKKAWVKALRSGEYWQADGQLGTKTNGNCCLGVLCYVAGKPKQAGNRGFIEKEFAKELGITRKIQDWCANMNDSQSYDFKKIASKLEKSPRV